MRDSKRFNVLAMMIAMALVGSACGGGDETNAADDIPSSDTVASDPPEDDTASVDSTEPPADDTAASAAEPEESTPGGGVILADLCAGGQPLNGAISVDDLVSFGLFTSTDVRIEGNAAYGASTYSTFGFICNIIEVVGDGENFLTIGVSSGSATWDLAVEQGNAPVEVMGDWEVIVGSNWLSPLTMRTTDSAGNQDSLFVVWTPSDGSIPDAETLERLMRPLAEAISARSTVDIPHS